MKKGLKITLLLLVVLFLIGSVLIIIGVATGGTMKFNINLLEKRVETSNEVYRGEEKLAAFSNVEINVDSADITIERGADYQISYAIRSSSEPVFTNDNGKLYFGKPKNQAGLFLNLGDINTKKEELYVKVIIPDNVDLNEAILDTDAGTINLDGINIKKLTADSDAGNINLSNIETEMLKIDEDAGNINLNNIKTGTVTLDNDSGKSTLDNLTGDSVTGKFDAGSISVKNGTIEKINIEIGAGETNILDSKISDVKIDSDFGSIKLELIGEAADYTIDSKVDFGSNEINGKKQGSTYSVNGGNKKIDIESDSGNVKIDFK